MVDMDAKTVSFTLNGRGEEVGMGVAFSGEGFRSGLMRSPGPESGGSSFSGITDFGPFEQIQPSSSRFHVLMLKVSSNWLI